MLVHFGADGLRPEWPSAVVGVGTFDGVHRGHRAVLGALVAHARDLGRPAVVVTFDRHPAATLAPDRCPPALATLDENLRDLASTGVDAVVVLPFDRALAAMTADAFFREILLGRLHAGRVVIGHDFGFGHDRQGDAAWLGDRIDTVVVEPHLWAGERVSSSAIRAAVAAGDVVRAAQLWGRAPAVAGIVVPGQRLGRQLGYPTANLARSGDTAVPADGVYAAWAGGTFGRRPAAVSIGCRPAVGGTHRTVEAFLLDYDGPEFYGTVARLEFVARLRDELPFPSLEALVEQMARDVAAVRELATPPPTLV